MEITSKYNNLHKDFEILRKKNLAKKEGGVTEQTILTGIEQDLLENLDMQLKTLNKQKNLGDLDENDIISSLIDDCDNLKKELEKSNNINLKLRNMIKNTESKIQGYNEDIKNNKIEIAKHNEELRR
jgi:hypothetical protein